MSKNKPEAHRLRAILWMVGLTMLIAGGWVVTTRPILVKTAKLSYGELINEVYGTGTLESKEMLNVSSKITGRVVEVTVDQGDTVATGQLLARLDPGDLNDAINVAAAQRNLAEVELEQAELNLKRTQKLFASSFTSASEFDTDTTALRLSQARLVATEAALKAAQAKLADTEIASPAAGLVVKRELEIGSTIVPGSPIFRIARSVPWLEAMVDGRSVAKLHIDQSARVTFESNPTQAIHGHLTRLSAEIDRVTEECEVDIALDERIPVSVLGQRADVYIETGRRQNILQMPLQALVSQKESPGCLTIENGKAKWRSLQLGSRSLKMVEIVGGIGEGELVILDPLAALKPITDGMRVKPAPSREAL
jgi:HlyD family secretion protein